MIINASWLLRNWWRHGNVLISSWENLNPLINSEWDQVEESKWKTDIANLYTRSQTTNECHSGSQLYGHLSSVGGMYYSQIRINTWNFRLHNLFGQGFQPPFRLPLIRVWAPHPRVMVATCDADNNVRAFGNRNLGEFTTIYVFNWGAERKDGSMKIPDWAFFSVSCAVRLLTIVQE